MEEHSKKQLNKIKNTEEKDPFTKSFELTGDDLKEELRKLHYVVREFNVRAGRSDLNN